MLFFVRQAVATVGFGPSSSVPKESTAGRPALAAAPVTLPSAQPGRGLFAVLLIVLACGTAAYLARAAASPVPAAAPSEHFSRQGLLSLPLAAQGPVSASLGAEVGTYAIRDAGAGLLAVNPAQHLHSSFTDRGVAVSSGKAQLGLRVLGVGYGSAVRPVGPAPPVRHGNRVVYSRPGLAEWYANGPLGLEQGFDVSSAPAVNRGGPLTIAIAASGNTLARTTDGARSILFEHGGGTLHYGGLSATDARGHALLSSFTLEHGRILLRVDAAGASYPVHIDPFVQQGGKLTGSGEVGEGEFGFRVALSGDGKTALIGAKLDNSSEGGAWVFTRSGSKWTQQGGKLTGAGAEGPSVGFGSDVALSEDGNTALVGGPLDNIETGAAWVFTRSGSTWTQQGSKLTVSGGTGENRVGSAVALSADGNTALLGGDNDSDGRGAAWVFTRSGSTWSQQGGKLTGSGEFGQGHVGSSAALSADGNTAIVGGPSDHTQVGAAWVFIRSGGVWSQQGAKLTGAGVSGEAQFGYDVALSASGDTAIAGGPGDNSGAGAAWVFTRSGSTWSAQGAKLTAGSSSNFGSAVALAGSGNLALIGARNDSSGVGAAWVFTRSGSTWTQGAKLTGSGESGPGEAGESAALSSDGATALVGGSRDLEGAGAAWVFASGFPPTFVGAPAGPSKTEATILAEFASESALSECKIEWGATAGYPNFTLCSFGEEGSTTGVGVLTGLTPETAYHFRVSASNAFGTVTSPNQTFATLSASERGELSETEIVEFNCSACLEPVSVIAGIGKGVVTVGEYGAQQIGGAPSMDSLWQEKETALKAVVADVSTSPATDTKSLQILLNMTTAAPTGETVKWWSGNGWLPASDVDYTSLVNTAKVTVNESTRPNLKQMKATRFAVGAAPGAAQYGKCAKTKGGNFTESNCLTVALKKGVPSHKGKYEWLPAPVSCFPVKKGFYSDSTCLTRSESKGKPKGKFEQGANAQTGTGGAMQLAITGQGVVECAASSSEEQIEAPRSGTITITFTGCKHGANQCTTTGQPAGAIRTLPVQMATHESEEKVFSGIVGAPITTFTCGGEEFTLNGGVAGQTTGDVNIMSAGAQTAFAPGTGVQALKTVGPGGEAKTTLTTTLSTTSAQPLEIDTHAGS